jgi:phospholipase/carboxylesterase
MTDFSFFESKPDGEHQFDERFACTRRFSDLANPIQEASSAESEIEDLPAHPEIIELIESLLEADPNLQPGSEVQISQRSTAVYLPEHYEAGYAYPLIVWFHGDGASENELHRVMPSISDRNYIGVALRGDVTTPTGCAWSADAANSPELLNDIRLIVTSLRRQYHIHSERIYLAGFGTGATTAVKLMLNKPEWFGGLISFSGEMPNADAPLARAEELKDKRVLLTTNLSASTTGVGDVVAAGRMLYSVGMKVGTRVYQDSATVPTTKMLRDLDSWLMDDICGSVKV